MEDSVKVSEEEIQEEQRLLRWYRKLAYATGNFITVLSISIWFPYNLVFFQNVLGLSASAAGNIVLISQIGGAISTPFIGTWSDQCYCPIPGRRKVFHLMGIICISCVLFFLWYDCLGCYDVAEPYKILYYSSFAIVFQFSWASIQIGQLALLPELCSQKKTQVQLNSMRYSFTIIANLIIFGCFWGLLELFNHDGSSDLSKNDLNIFPIMVAIVIGLGFPSSVLFQFLIPEKKNVILKKLKWYKWLMNPKFYLTAACLVASRFIVLLPQGYIPFYFQKTLNMDKSSIAKGPLVLFIVSFVSTLVVKRFRNFIGDKMTYFLGMAIVWAALIFFWVKDPTTDTDSHFNWSRDCIYIATVLLGAGGAVVIVIALSMISFLVGSYKGSSAFVYGWILFCDRASNGIAVNVIQHLLPQDDKLQPEFYRNVMVYVPFFGSAVGLFVIVVMLILEWARKRHRKKMSHKRKKSVGLNRSINYGATSDVSSINTDIVDNDDGSASDSSLDEDVQRFTETL